MTALALMNHDAVESMRYRLAEVIGNTHRRCTQARAGTVHQRSTCSATDATHGLLLRAIVTRLRRETSSTNSEPAATRAPLQVGRCAALVVVVLRSLAARLQTRSGSRRWVFATADHEDQRQGEDEDARRQCSRFTHVHRYSPTTSSTTSKSPASTSMSSTETTLTSVGQHLAARGTDKLGTCFCGSEALTERRPGVPRWPSEAAPSSRRWAQTGSAPHT
jgi:hypothetical protein